MIKYVSCLILFFSVFSGIAQKQYVFEPHWKVGDKREVIIKESLKMFVQGNGKSSSISEKKGEITVLSKTDSNYIINWKLNNETVQAIIEYHKRLGELLTPYTQIDLKCSIDKKKKTIKVLNVHELESVWKKTEKICNDFFKQKRKTNLWNHSARRKVMNILKLWLRDIDTPGKLDNQINRELFELLMPFYVPLYKRKKSEFTDVLITERLNKKADSVLFRYRLKKYGEKSNTCIMIRDLKGKKLSHDQQVGKELGVRVKEKIEITFNHSTGWVKSATSYFKGKLGSEKGMTRYKIKRTLIIRPI